MLNYDDDGRKLMCGCTQRHPWPFPNQHFAPWHQHNTRIVLGHRRRTPASTLLVIRGLVVFQMEETLSQTEESAAQRFLCL